MNNNVFTKIMILFGCWASVNAMGPTGMTKAELEKALIEVRYGDAYADLHNRQDNIIVDEGGETNLINFLQDFSLERTDVITLYFWAKQLAENSKVLADNYIEQANRTMLVLLLKVYCDVMSFKALNENREIVYEMMREKINYLWYPQIAARNPGFKGSIPKLVKQIQKWMDDAKILAPSAAWVMFCNPSGWQMLKIPFTDIKAYPNTIKFENVDSRYNSNITVNFETIQKTSELAEAQFTEKLKKIDGLEGLTFVQKMQAFLSLSFAEITKI